MSESSNNAGKQAVIATLKGPVAEIFRKLLPPLRALPAAEVYALAMANGDLLNGCLQIFDKKRDAFAHLLVDERNRPVKDDFVKLRCGYSVHDIIGMITRTHAKRHFSAALGGNPNDPSTKAGRMYQAMKEYLIHSWQVPLVPHYAPLPVEQVEAMGPAILEVKEAATLDKMSGVEAAQIAAARAIAVNQAAKENASAAVMAAVSAALPGISAPQAPQATGQQPPEQAAAPPPPIEARPDPTPSGPLEPGWVPMTPSRPARPAPKPRFEGTPQEEFWYQTLDDRQVRSALDIVDEDEVETLAKVFAHLGEPCHTGFLAPLRLSMPQAAVALTVAWRTMGERAFKAVFGVPGDAREIAELTKRLNSQGVGSRTDLRTIARMMEPSLRIKQLNRKRA